MLPAAGMQRGSRYGGGHRGPTAGLAPGFVQGNLAILPAPLASDFLRFCQFNPKPCPLIGTSATGYPRVPELGEDLDIRFDLPRYGVAELRPGGGIGRRARPLARRSGEFRHRLLVFIRRSADGGVHRTASNRARPQRDDRTSIAAHAAGPFHGPMVVSMRPLRPADAIRAVQITTRFPAVHGAPVHIGKPELIGIA